MEGKQAELSDVFRAADWLQAGTVNELGELRRSRHRGLCSAIGILDRSKASHGCDRREALEGWALAGAAGDQRARPRAAGPAAAAATFRAGDLIIIINCDIHALTSSWLDVWMDGWR